MIIFTPSSGRVDHILELFREAFRAGAMQPGLAATLRGKLFFLLTAAYGAVGRAATLPLVTRQYRDVSVAFVKGDEIWHTWQFFEALLPRLPPLHVPLEPPSVPSLIVYTDAAFHLRRSRHPVSGSCDSDLFSRLHGGLGAVVFDPFTHRAYWAAGKPDWELLLRVWPASRKTYIAQLETLAAISVYTTFPKLFAGRRVQHWVDNTVALSALVHGYSGKPDLAQMVNIFHLQAAGLRTPIYLEYVASKANIADLPSRNAFAELSHELRGWEVSGGHRLSVPSLAHWSRPLEAWATNPAAEPHWEA